MKEESKYTLCCQTACFPIPILSSPLYLWAWENGLATLCLGFQIMSNENNNSTCILGML